MGPDTRQTFDSEQSTKLAGLTDPNVRKAVKQKCPGGRNVMTWARKIRSDLRPIENIRAYVLNLDRLKSLNTS